MSCKKQCMTCDFFEPTRFSDKPRCTCPLPIWLFGGQRVIDEDEKRIVNPKTTGCPAYRDES